MSLILGFLSLASTALLQAQTNREQLSQYVADLQKRPDDHSLREKIIKLVQGLEPRPEVPEDARRHFVKAATIQKESKDAQALDLAINEYKQALLIAPWWAEAYYNLGVASEQASRLDTAIDALKLYLLTNPSGTEAREAQDRLYAIEGKKDLAARNAAAEAEAATRKEQEEAARRDEAFRRLAGTWVWNDNKNSRYDHFNYYELTVTGKREFTLKWTRSSDEVYGPWEEVYRVSVDGLQLSGTVSVLLHVLNCGNGRVTANVTGRLSEAGDKIEFEKATSLQWSSSCQMQSWVPRPRMTLVRER